MSDRREDSEEARPGFPPEAYDYEDDVTPEGMALVRAWSAEQLKGRTFRRLSNEEIAERQAAAREALEP